MVVEKSITLLFALFFILDVVHVFADYPAACIGGIPAYEFDALYSIFNSTNGEHWLFTGAPTTKWTFPNSPDVPCVDSWQGLYCMAMPAGQNETVPCTLYSINLAHTQLLGPLPNDIGKFARLEVLDLSGNSITGTLPSEIGLLQNMDSIYVNENLLEGRIPASIFNISTLAFIELGSNIFSQSLPPIWGSMPLLTDAYFDSNLLTGSLPTHYSEALEYLYFNYNLFSGHIPTELGGVTTLTSLQLYQTVLSGPIPSELGNLLALTSFFADESRITGSLPSELGRLSLLTSFSVETCFLTGTIPTEYSGMHSLEVLNWFSNFFTGTLPTELASLPNLKTLYIDQNLLTGTISPDFGAMNSVSEIYLYTNLFTGTMPPQLYSESMTQLEIGDNLLTGTVPTPLSNMPRLAVVNLDVNFFSGTIPSEFGSYASLTGITFDQNLFNGTMPSELGQLTALTALFLYSTSITGTIPTELGNLVNMESLYMFSNSFVGTIPTELGRMTNLVVLYLYDNSLSGTIPTELANMRNSLQLFVLDNNNLVGTLPTEVGELSLLTYLDVDNNHLTGCVPSEIGLLPALIILNLYENKFTSSLPENIFNASTLNQVVINGNFITGTLPAYGVDSLTQLVVSANLISGSLPNSLQQAINLQLFNASANLITGDLSGVFNSSMPHSLNYLDLSKNSITGSLPSAIFHYSSIQAITLESNCMSGSLPDDICEASSLVVLVLDGLSAGPSCRTYIPDALQTIIRSSFSTHLLHGSIPSCVWSMGNLTTLHLSGNGLSGSLGEVPANSRLQDLNLANNFLTGTIPESIQVSGTYVQLVLSQNKLSGTLSGSFFISSNNTNVDFSVNRLSGEIPDAFMAAENVNILDGNLFQCETDDMPEYDPQTKQYVCGSNDLNYSIIVWCSLMGISFIGVIYAIYKTGKFQLFQSQDGPEPGCWQSMSTGLFISLRWLTSNPQLFDDSAALASVSLASSRFLNLLKRSGLCCLMVSGVYMLVLIICTAMKAESDNLNFAFSTHTMQYSWVTTMAYLHGVFPVVIILVALLVAQQILRVFFLQPETIDSQSALQSEDAKSGMHMASSDSTGHSEAGNESNGSWGLFCRANSLLMLTHILNGTISLTINLLYVLAIFQGLNQRDLTVLQICLSAYKLTWNKMVIPFTVSRLRFLSAGSRTWHSLSMCVFNYIIGPVVATYLTDSSCLYFALNGQDNAVSLYQETENLLPGCVVVAQLSITKCATYPQAELLTTSITPPWLYSYQCSSSLFTNYIPVLLFTFTVSGIIIPTLKFILVSTPSASIESLLPQWMYRGSIIDPQIYDASHSDNVHDDSDQGLIASRRLFSGNSVTCAMLLNIAVLFTFGLASPILGLAISLEVLCVGVVWHLMLERFAANVQAAGPDAKSLGGLFERLKLSLHGSYDGLEGSCTVIVTSAGLFWSLVFFDMLADVYGNLIGGILSIIIALLIPAVFSLSNASFNIFGCKQASAAGKAPASNVPRSDISADFDDETLTQTPFKMRFTSTSSGPPTSVLAEAVAGSTATMRCDSRASTLDRASVIEMRSSTVDHSIVMNSSFDDPVV